MSSLSLSMPDVRDRHVVVREREARRIFKFFWPSHGARIEDMAVTFEDRRYAQELLMVAIDGSEVKSRLLQGLQESLGLLTPVNITRIRQPVRRVLGINEPGYWSHGRPSDLESVRIYETIRRSIAVKQRTKLEEHIYDATSIESRRRPIAFVMDLPSY